jgi:phosphatidylinositol alpha-1,6-mannosyltransferase
METLSVAVSEALKRHLPTDLIALRRSGRSNLLWFLPSVALGVALRARGSKHLIVFGDPIVFGAVRPLLTRRHHVVVMVMGLDLTYPNRVYQAWMRSALQTADRVVAISEATAKAALAMGVPPSRLAVLNPGLSVPDPTEAERSRARADLCAHTGLDVSRFIVLTLGRVIRRKGVLWFVREVMPLLPPEVTYLVAGAGKALPEVAEARESAGVATRVLLLGQVDDGLRDLLMTGSDLLLMPNVPVPGDMEGFGLVAIEAALRGTVVVASDLEGIRDAVIHGRTGYLCKPGDAGDFVARVSELVRDPKEVSLIGRRFQLEASARYSLERMAQELPDAFGL